MKALVLIIGVLVPIQGLAVCASLIKGNLAFNVTKCGRIVPEKTFAQKNERLNFINDLSPDDRKMFFESYRGLLVEGLVVRSLAVRSGLTPEKGALNGEVITAFVPPGKISCSQIGEKRIKAFLDEACCEGGGTAPCLLNTTYVFKEVKVLGSQAGGAGNAKRMRLENNKTFKKANSNLRKKRFDEAVDLYEQLRNNGQLDVRGHYFLGYSYRMLDQCSKAIPILEYVHRKSERKNYWANEETTVRKANLLYARCLSRVGKGGEAVLVLQGFLADAKRYKSEITLSLTHGDFGRIRTTKDFQLYIQDAQTSLRRLSNQQ